MAFLYAQDGLITPRIQKMYQGLNELLCVEGY